MPAYVQQITTFNTTQGAHVANITPAANGLLIAVAGYTAGTTQLGSVTDDQAGGTYAKVASTFQAAPRCIEVFVRDNLSTAVAHAVTQADPPGADTGGGLVVMEFSGFTNPGSGTFKQSGQQDNTAAGTPAPAFPSSVDTNNMTIAVCSNGTNPATMTTPASWTERVDTGYATPTNGLHICTRDSGFTGTTVTWGSASASNFCAVVVEFRATSPPYLFLSPTVAFR